MIKPDTSQASPLVTRRAVIAGPLALAGAALLTAAEKKPNIVFVIATRWRGHAVPWADDPDLVAPNLARLGERSMTFSRAYAAGSRSGESQESIRTGLYAHMLSPDAVPLRQRLSRAGYRAAGFGGRDIEELVSFIHMDGEPFFAEWILDTTAGFLQRINPESMHVRENVPQFRRPQAQSDLAGFYARVKARDRDLGVLLAALDRPQKDGSNLKDDTLFVFVSDRGEPLGAHGTNYPDESWEESLRIPLAISLPNRIAAGSSDLLISHVDIVPTVLSLCGAEVPAHLPGKDFSAHLRGEKFERPEAIYAEGRLGEKDEWRVLIHGYDKLITDKLGDVKALYNLAEDPLEMNNLSGVASSQLTRDALVATQRDWMRRLEDGMDSSGLRRR